MQDRIKKIYIGSSTPRLLVYNTKKIKIALKIKSVEWNRQTQTDTSTLDFINIDDPFGLFGVKQIIGI